jgi:Uma2 family endonuclease
MADLARRKATYADIEALPENMVGEIINGSLETHPRPVPRHVLAGDELSGTLRGPFRLGEGGPGGWIFMSEPELHLGPHVVVPDIAGWRRNRMNALPTTAYIETPPDWVCEILSPATARFDKGQKRQIYADADVPFIWLLDPDSRILDVYQLTAGKWLLLGTVVGGDPISLPPFEAISFSLDSLFPLDPPTQEN